ncbi:hypothetical protein [Litorilituus sediminis]|uniref:Uncharacterized protein n=1 Tax=Litorilituus sediminis TaxID=718192 RepID=A0A4P6PA94_9GAMM|nr:hypothetical protein [Litorilituus sediminis]QBG36487.1 hypothetical protein EMK97_12545 [Litorilituus sediminis]
MFKALTNILVIITMLAAFFAQAWASSSALPCQSLLTEQPFSLISEIPSASIDTLAAQNTLSAESEDDCCDIDCCTLDCLCLANGCISFAYLSNTIGGAAVMAWQENSYLQDVEQAKFIVSSLFRPPIVNS